MPLFEVRKLTAGYNRAPIVHGVDLDLEAGKMATIIGPNGAGKSTLIKAIFGFCDVLSGSVRIEGREVGGLRPSQVVASGIGYVPQVENIFPTLTVRENLEMGAYLSPKGMLQRIDEIVAMFPDLAAAMRRQAGELSGGQRNMLALARALMTRPKVLLLDEPTAGLSPIYVEKVWEYIATIVAAGVAVLVVEQNARRALSVSDYGYLMVAGRLAQEGTGKELLESEDVVAHYLGGAQVG
jgi:branched-chain amino acid transport system ATP-binding protein